MAKKTPAPPRITYAPEVEAKREAYSKIGAQLHDLLNVEYDSTAGFVLDITPPGVMAVENEHKPDILYKAIYKHLDALFEDIKHSHGEEFWTTLYVELRLHYDEQMSGRGTKARQREEGAQ